MHHQSLAINKILNTLRIRSTQNHAKSGLELSYSKRVETAINFKKVSVNDFFGGWELSDILLLEKFRHIPGNGPAQGEILDFLGVRTSHSVHAWLNADVNQAIWLLDLPVPDDGVHAETIEYVALLNSISIAKINQNEDFVVLEIGASYGPWASTAGVVAARQNFKKILIIELEVNNEAQKMALEHLQRNGLAISSVMEIRLVNAAISTENGNAYFPKVDVRSDNGAQISIFPSNLDYRGLPIDNEKVDTITLSTLLSDVNRIDFLHIDVQGTEESLLENSQFIDTLTRKVVALFLATQTRKIEGIALETLAAMGWKLLRERPTTYKQNDRTNNIKGWTLRDGGQYWINMNLTDSLGSL